MTSIVVRPFDPKTDSGFIFSSWAKGVYYKTVHDIALPKSEFFRIFHQYAVKTLDSAQVLIACISNDPHTIIGYSIIDGPELQWVYVKELFRKHGIASLLTRDKGIQSVNEDNLTKIGLSILRKHPEFQKKEPVNEQDARIAN